MNHNIAITLKAHMLLIVLSVYVAALFTASAQEREYYEPAEADWSEWLLNVEPRQKRIFIDQVRDIETMRWVFENNEKAVIEQSFKIVDFNRDGHADLIYTGLLGSESNALCFFLKTENGFKEIIMLYGMVIGLSAADTGEPLSFKLLNYPCCGGLVNHFEYYKGVRDRDSFQFIIQSKDAMFSETKIPRVFFDKTIFFEIDRSSYNLRAEPVIVNSGHPTEYAAGINSTNIIAVYAKGTKGYALGRHIDSSGREWWFVNIKSDSKPISSGFSKGDNNDYPYDVFGWMSSRYLRRVWQ